jgi:hypothetical protein
VQEAVFRHGPQATGLNDVVLEVATRANDQLSTARMYIEEARKKDKRQFNSAMCVFLPIVCQPQIGSHCRWHQGSTWRGWKK